MKSKVESLVENKILHAMLGDHAEESQLTEYLGLLREGLLEERTIEIEIPVIKGSSNELRSTLDSDRANFYMQDLLKNAVKSASQRRAERKKVSIKEARKLLEEGESERLLEDHDVTKEAITAVEESGIVFIDEIDKLVNNSDYRGADASSEGVQRDLLPLIEGSTISTKHGNVNTDFILFIASGAFHSAKPSDLLAELQGRLPIRVTLSGLTQDDLFRILTEPVSNLLKQQIEMIKSEEVELSFTEAAIREIAKVTFETNKSIENIGARRLHTVIERIVEEISFDAPSKRGEKVEITEEYVKMRVADLLKSTDLRKYIL